MSRTPAPQPAPASTPPWRPAFPPLLGVVLAAGLAGFGWAVTRELILPGVTVEGVRLGGRTRAQAEELIRSRLVPLLRQPVHLKHGSGEEALRLDRIGLTLDVPATLEAAYAPGHRGPLGQRVKAWLGAGRAATPVRAVLRWDQQAFDVWLADLRKRHAEPAVEVGWRPLPNGSVEVTPSALGRDVSERELRQRLQAAAFAPSNRRTVELPLYTVHPRRTMEEAVALDIREVVARYRTYFNQRDQNRTANVRLAAAAVDQTVLQPGEVFSFNRAVGPRLPASGYREAPVVVKGRLVPGVGGGVCQVSSTLYNAALLGNLDVLTRHRHSIPSAYVPPGRDATVAYDYFDLQFRNTYDWPVVIDTEVGSGWLEARILGRRRPGERVEVETEIVESYAPTAEEVPDPLLPRGQRVQVTKGSPGYRVKVWRVLYRDDVVVERRLLSDDRYQPLQGLVKVGTGPLPATQPALPRQR
ncbi:MAG: VanW family protein [Betaproteobacteria bacterium]